MNEAIRIPQLFKELEQFRKNNCEIIIVDGGSTDNSVEIAENKGFRVEKTTCGRAHQMNTGAEKASGSTLLFLHADTQLPDDDSSSYSTGLARQNIGSPGLPNRRHRL